MADSSNNYTQFHRDIAVGFMAGDLLQDGYFGKDIELCGIVCTYNAQRIFLYGTDAVTVNKVAYDYMVKGAKIEHILNHTFHLKMDETEDKLGQNLADLVQENLNLKFDQIIEIEKKDELGYWAGFAYEEDGVRKEFINGYFPRVFEEFLQRAQGNVTPIVFQKIADLFDDRKQLRLKVEEMLKNAAI